MVVGLLFRRSLHRTETNDVNIVRSPFFRKDRANPYSVNQSARMVGKKPVDHVVIDWAKANDTVHKKDEGA
jgi:hypothetical protein